MNKVVLVSASSPEKPDKVNFSSLLPIQIVIELHGNLYSITNNTNPSWKNLTSEPAV